MFGFDIDEAKFWRLVDQRDPDECWEWQGTRKDGGYGLFNSNGTQTRSNRVVLYLTVGDAPLGKPHALHSCDNPPCCNPRHLRWGTQAENNADRIERGRHHNAGKTHCKRGHEYTDGSYYQTTDGRRDCKACATDRRKPFLKGRAIGVRMGAAKLTEDQAREIFGSAQSSRVLAKAYGISHTTVGSIKRGELWRHATMADA